jgi:hypothetical protein
MSFGITMVDADGNTLEGPPGEAPAGLIGALVETPSGGYVAVPARRESGTMEGNLGLYATFELAVRRSAAITAGSGSARGGAGPLADGDATRSPFLPARGRGAEAERLRNRRLTFTRVASGEGVGAARVRLSPRGQGFAGVGRYLSYRPDSWPFRR